MVFLMEIDRMFALLPPITQLATGSALSLASKGESDCELAFCREAYRRRTGLRQLRRLGDGIVGRGRVAGG
jgi:hypothetical protein